MPHQDTGPPRLLAPAPPGLFPPPGRQTLVLAQHRAPAPPAAISACIACGSRTVGAGSRRVPLFGVVWWLGALVGTKTSNRGQCFRWAGAGGAGRGVPASSSCRGGCPAPPGPPVAGLPRPLSLAGVAHCPPLALLPPGPAHPGRGSLPCTGSPAPVCALLPAVLSVPFIPRYDARIFALSLRLPSGAAACHLSPVALRPHPCPSVLCASTRAIVPSAPFGSARDHSTLQLRQRDGSGCVLGGWGTGGPWSPSPGTAWWGSGG